MVRPARLTGEKIGHLGKDLASSDSRNTYRNCEMPLQDYCLRWTG